MRANYSIVDSESNETTLTIKDEGPWDQFKSVTNAVELVVKELTAGGKLTNGKTLYYYDSLGQKDQIVHKDGHFVTFQVGTERTYLAIGPRCWGKGDSEEAAIRKMKNEGGFRANKKVSHKVFLVHPETYVDEMGYLRFPMPHDPKLVREVIIGTQ